jgi:hypothetical protein
MDAIVLQSCERNIANHLPTEAMSFGSKEWQKAVVTIQVQRDWQTAEQQSVYT